MAALAPPPPSAPASTPQAAAPAPPAPNNEPRLNTPPQGSGGLESRLASALAAPPPAPPAPQAPPPTGVTPPSTASQPPAPPEGTPASTPPEPPSGTSLEEFDFDNPPQETPVDPNTPTPEGEAPPSPLDEIKPLLAKETLTGEEADKVRGAFLKTEHGRRMYAAHQMRQELEKPPEEGGLGRMPTLDEIRQGEADRLAMVEMTQDFSDNPENWLANFFGHRDAQGQVQFRPGVEVVIDSLPGHLQQVAPQLHSRLAANLAAPYFARVAQDIAAMPQRTQQEAEAKLIAGRGLNLIEQQLLGRITRLPGFDYEDGQRAGQPQNPNDPLAQERARLQQQQEAFQRQQQQALQAQQQQVHQQIVGDLNTTLVQDAQNILRAAGLHRHYSEMVFDQLTQTFLSQARQAVEGDPRNARAPLNPAGLKTFNLHLRSAVAGQADRNLPVSTYRRMAQEAMRRDAEKFVAKAVGNAQAQNTALHASAAGAASRREVAPGATPQGAPPPAQRIERSKGQSGADYLEDRVRSMLGGTQ